MATQLILDDLYIGDRKTIVIQTTVASGDRAGEPKDPLSATFLCYDPDRGPSGTADSGTPTTLLDADRTEPDEFWKGLPITIITAADGREYQSAVVGFEAASHTLTFYALPAAVAAGDQYRLGGYPLVPETIAAPWDNEASVELTPTDALGTVGRRVLVYRADFGSDAEEAVGAFNVLGAGAG